MKTASRERIREIIAQHYRERERQAARRKRVEGIGWRDVKEATPRD